MRWVVLIVAVLSVLTIRPPTRIVVADVSRLTVESIEADEATMRIPWIGAGGAKADQADGKERQISK